MENIVVATMAALLGRLLIRLPLASGREKGHVRNFGNEEDITTIAELKLTPDQADQITAIREGYINDTKLFQEKMRDRREELKSFWLRENPDRKKIAAAEKEIEMLRYVLWDMLLDYREAISKVLNEEQQRNLETMSQPQQMRPWFRWKKDRFKSRHGRFQMLYSIIVAIVIVFSGPASALTMEEAVATGLRNSPAIQAFRLEEDAAQGQMQKAKLPPYSNPVIEGGFSFKDRSPDEGGDQFVNNEISISQSVEVGGQRRLRIDTATHNLARVRMEIHDLERSLMADIRDHFGQALFLRDKMALAEEFVRLQEELSRLVAVKYEAGDVAALEVNLSQVELAKARRDRIALSTAYKNALLSLKALIGMAPDAELIPEGDLAAGLAPLPDREALLGRLPARPDIKAAEAETLRSGAALTLAEKEWIPNVTWRLFQAVDERRYDRGGTLSVEIPLFDRKEAERTEARARASQARVREAGVTRNARKEFDEAHASATSSLSDVEVFKQAILGRSAENLALLQYAFREGKISFYDVRIAQRETIELRNLYLDALLSVQRAYNALERAVGGDLR